MVKIIMTPFNLLPTRSSLYVTRPGVWTKRVGHRGRGLGVNNLLEEWAPHVYRFALRLCNDSHIAEDLAQETFLRAWRHRSRLRDERAVRIWLFRIAANLWRDQLRRNRSPVARADRLSDHQLPDVVDRSSGSAEHLVGCKEELTRALRMMNDLPARQREVLYLNACEGLSSAEIADVLDLSREAVKASLSLARKKMREQLLHPMPNPTSIE